jgi:hypothetical protein
VRAGRKKLSSVLIPDDLDDGALGTVADCIDAITRYHAATNVAMSLEYSPESTKELIKLFVEVPQKLKDDLKADWKASMGFGRPIPACGSCGLRDLNTRYATVTVRDLPECFIIKPGSSMMERFETLQRGIELLELDVLGNPTTAANGTFKMSQVDLSPIMSYYDDVVSGRKYHLHANLVEEDGTFACCANCLDLIAVEGNTRRAREQDTGGGGSRKLPQLQSLGSRLRLRKHGNDFERLSTKNLVA